LHYSICCGLTSKFVRPSIGILTILVGLT